MAKVITPFDGCVDGSSYVTSFKEGDTITGNLAAVAIREGWATADEGEAPAPAPETGTENPDGTKSVTVTLIPTEAELKAKPVTELKTIAKKLGLKLASKAKEHEIIAVIIAHYEAKAAEEEAAKAAEAEAEAKKAAE